ncbi:MAG: hypothetical protein IT292_05125 [Deltaproteobacteria bacterium]|nr:hypothetical protein [Deltaproteobacteria bacterium]
MQIKLEQLYPLARLITPILGMITPDHTPIVGTKTFNYKGRSKQSILNRPNIPYSVLTPSMLGIPAVEHDLSENNGQAVSSDVNAS